MRLRKNVSDLDPRRLDIQYGPSGSRFSGSVDLFTEISARMNLGAYSVHDLVVEEVHHAPNSPYFQSDRHLAPPGYMVAGSLGCRLICPDGREASLYIVDFHHTRDFHHNIWLWGRDFDGSRIYDRNVPHHDSIPLDELVYIRVTLGSDYFEDTFKSPIKTP
jgi:hypothetical protein